jgi:type VI secretion system protein ImpI
VRRLAAGAGVAPELFAGREPGALAEELGALLRIVATELKQLLAARAEAKRAARSSNQTMVQALDNNPLKFSPTLEDALRVMFGQPSPGYLDARRTVEQSFRDVRLHEVKTYAAMQHALRMLVEDLDPAAIAKAEAGGGGIGGLVGSKKARMWEVYRARWEALTAPHEDGILGAFMLFFAECYDKGRGR